MLRGDHSTSLSTIGTVNAAELAVALAASAGFLQSLGSAGVRWDFTAAMLLGGVLAAIPAAWLVRHINERTLGVAVGALILMLSVDSFLSLLQVPEGILLAFRVVGAGVTVILLGASVIRALYPGRAAEPPVGRGAPDAQVGEYDRGLGRS